VRNRGPVDRTTDRGCAIGPPSPSGQRPDVIPDQDGASRWLRARAVRAEAFGGDQYLCSVAL